jgi:hypothetical protein
MKQNGKKAAEAGRIAPRAKIQRIVRWAALECELTSKVLRLVADSKPSDLGAEGMATLAALALNDTRVRAAGIIRDLALAAGRPQK